MGEGGVKIESLGCHLVLKLVFSKLIYKSGNLVTKIMFNTALLLNQITFSLNITALYIQSECSIFKSRMLEKNSILQMPTTKNTEPTSNGSRGECFSVS